MIHYDPQGVHPIIAAEFEQQRRFMEEAGARETDYWVGRDCDGPVPDSFVTILYAPDPKVEGGFIADLSWRTATGRSTVRTDLGEALFMLAFAFDTPANRDVLADIAAETDTKAAVESLDLPRDTIRDAVGTDMPGEYVARSGSSWVYYLVEPNGAIIEIASAAEPAPLLQMLKAGKLQFEQRLAERLASHLVPIASSV